MGKNSLTKHRDLETKLTLKIEKMLKPLRFGEKLGVLESTKAFILFEYLND